MVWNIHFQFAGLILIIVVAAMCLIQRRLNFRAERAFIRLLFCIFLCLTFDILSIVAINYQDMLHPITVQIICKLYLVSIVIVACQAALYSAAEIRHAFSKFWINMTYVPIFIEGILFFFAPVNIHLEGEELYTYGLPVTMTYVLCAVYLISTLIMSIVLRKEINSRSRASINFWMISWMLAAAIQFFNNQFLIVGFAMAMACMYMYCKLENPEYHLDFATNVFNHKGFTMLMTEAIKTHRNYAIITFVIEDSGRVTEIFGSKAVEKIVLQISAFADNIPGVILFRLEDDTFCLSTEPGEKAESALETLVKRFELPWEVGGASVEVSAAFSYIDDISEYDDEDELEEVIHYFARESLKKKQDILFVGEEELANRQKNIQLKHDLEWAFQNDALEVYFQPIYNIKEGRFNSMEALARVHDRNGNMIMPSDFIEFAEKNGMILRLGEIVFRKVCDFIRRTHIEEYGIDYIEVNLSVVQCMQDDMARVLKNIMGEYQVPPYRINFEITETALASSRAAMDRNMNELINYGSGFSLDDYGSGYSNLSYVINLPLSIIKLDKQMVDDYFLSEKVKITTEYTINMIHSLNMKVVVEGIETEEQYQAFKKLGVEYIQGYYFSSPLPSNEVLRYIQEWL